MNWIRKLCRWLRMEPYWPVKSRCIGATPTTGCMWWPALHDSKLMEHKDVPCDKCCHFTKDCNDEDLYECEIPFDHIADMAFNFADANKAAFEKAHKVHSDFERDNVARANKNIDAFLRNASIESDLAYAANAEYVEKLRRDVEYIINQPIRSPADVYPTDFRKQEEKMQLVSKEKCREIFQEVWKHIAKDINDWATEKGFWEKGKDRNQAEMLCLMHSELSEALEGLRHGNPPSEHIPEFSAMEEELADTVIRIMDMGHGFGYDVAGALMAKMAVNEGRPYKHGKEF